MCGIAGFVNFDGTPAQANLLGAMTQAIAHRGPDGEGIQLLGPFGLGHRRLSIIDLSQAGRQPMSNETGDIWVSFNGEIYNFAELRDELESAGHVFQSRTDTEVIVHAYEQWGEACLDRFNGMFAFALVDVPKGILWLVRDRLGVKPLFYCQTANHFVFGSEIKAVLAHPSVKREMDVESLAYFLALNYTPAPHTLFRNVRQVPPGCALTVRRDGSVASRTWWDWVFQEGETRSQAAWIEEMRHLLEDSVKVRLVSDVPFGVFLSGGVDSSTVAYWMAQLLPKPVQSFSVHFGEKSFDEDQYARQVAQLLNTQHHQQRIEANAVEVLPQIVFHAEEPTADSSMVAMYFLAKHASQHVKMALSGDGADELFAGYETYTAYYLHRLYRSMPAFLRNTLPHLFLRLLPVSDAKVSLDFKLRRFFEAGNLTGEQAHASWRMIFGPKARQELLAPIWDTPGAQKDVQGLYAELFAGTNARHPLNRLLYADTRFYLPNDMLVKVDRMTMAHGLEAREPMLDYRLVDFAGRVPPNLKLRRFVQKKYLLKAAMKDRLPANILWRKKAGFNVPNARWIKGPMRDFTWENLSGTRLKNMAFLSSDAVGRLLSEHDESRADHSHQIWGLLTLSLWFQRFML